ncbi:MAG: DUF1351 domain-containing protein [Clostridiales bacterium]|nr:DUF1351 domain-containing protein [Clostridiales bacterium]
MSAAEFRITTDLAPLRQFQIEANFEETKAWLTENLEPLRTMAVTPDSTAQAKQYRAAVRKIRDRIDESRKMAKAAALEAYSSFETKCKELTALCDEAANALDVQIKAMEEAAKQEKKNRLAEYFAQVVGDMAEWLTFDDCFNPKWLNATCAESTAWMDINAAIDRCRADLNAIRALHSEFETTLLDEYTRTRNISAVLVKNETLGRMKAAEEDRKRKEAEAAAKYAAAQQQKMTPLKPECIGESDEYEVIDIVGTVEPKRTQPVNDLVDEDGHEIPPAQEPEYKVDFRVFGTARQLDGLKAYMQKNGIRFMPVPQE